MAIVRRLCGAIIGVVLLVLPVSAWATLFVFEQESASLPGLSVSASITINGGFSDLPTVNSHSSPIDFGNLLALSFVAPGAIAGTYSLSDFVAPPPFHNFPLWSINPTRIDFVDALDSNDFHMMGFGAISQITLNTDGPFLCHRTGACVVTGIWEPAPEPASLALFATGLAAIALVHRRKCSRADTRVNK
jgi:hypothetical protein